MIENETQDFQKAKNFWQMKTAHANTPKTGSASPSPATSPSKPVPGVDIPTASTSVDVSGSKSLPKMEDLLDFTNLSASPTDVAAVMPNFARGSSEGKTSDMISASETAQIASASQSAQNSQMRSSKQEQLSQNDFDLLGLTSTTTKRRSSVTQPPSCPATLVDLPASAPSSTSKDSLAVLSFDFFSGSQAPVTPPPPPGDAPDQTYEEPNTPKVQRQVSLPFFREEPCTPSWTTGEPCTPMYPGSESAEEAATTPEKEEKIANAMANMLKSFNEFKEKNLKEFNEFKEKNLKDLELKFAARGDKNAAEVVNDQSATGINGTSINSNSTASTSTSNYSDTSGASSSSSSPLQMQLPDMSVWKEKMKNMIPMTNTTSPTNSIEGMESLCAKNIHCPNTKGLVENSTSQAEKTGFGEMIVVEVLGGRDLAVGDFIKGESDPYVILKFKGEERKSQVVKGTVNPVYNERFIFWVQEQPKENEMISVIFLNKNLVIADEKLGEVHLTLDIPLNQTCDDWFPLMKDNGELKGRVRMGVRRLAITSTSVLLAAQAFAAKERSLNDEDLAEFGSTVPELWYGFSNAEEPLERVNPAELLATKFNDFTSRLMRKNDRTGNGDSDTKNEPEVRRNVF